MLNISTAKEQHWTGCLGLADSLFDKLGMRTREFLSTREMNSCHMFYLLLVRQMKASHLTQVCESSRETWGPHAPCVLASLIIIFHAAEAHRAHPPVSPTVSCF